MSTSAPERRCYLANNSARDIANSLFQKWAVKGFFRRVNEVNRGRGQPRRGYRRPKPTAHSDVGRLRSRRAACFLWYFLSRRKKVLSPVGAAAPHLSRRSRRVIPPGAMGLRLRAHQRAFLSPFGNLRAPKTHRAASLNPRRSQRVIPHPGQGVCACGPRWRKTT